LTATLAVKHHHPTPGASRCAAYAHRALQLSFPQNGAQPGRYRRAPTPGKPGSYDLVFNIGAHSITILDRQVTLSGLATVLDGDSLYASRSISAASKRLPRTCESRRWNPKRDCMGFYAGTGDFYFADNAIDGTGRSATSRPGRGIEPDRRTRSRCRVAPDFGYPTAISNTGPARRSVRCVQPLFAFQPIANGTPLGSESEVWRRWHLRRRLPNGFNNGIFFGFSGKGGDRTANEENAVGYYDFATGIYPFL